MDDQLQVQKANKTSNLPNLLKNDCQDHTGRKQTNDTNNWAKFSIAIFYTENAEVKLTWSGG